jgi:hypothetical protein
MFNILSRGLESLGLISSQKGPTCKRPPPGVSSGSSKRQEVDNGSGTYTNLKYGGDVTATEDESEQSDYSTVENTSGTPREKIKPTGVRKPKKVPKSLGTEQARREADARLIEEEAAARAAAIRAGKLIEEAVISSNIEDLTPGSSILSPHPTMKRSKVAIPAQNKPKGWDKLTP